MNTNIKNYIRHILPITDRDDSTDQYTLTSDIPTEEIAIFLDNLFFLWQKEVDECAEAIRQVLKEEGKRYFVIARNSTFFMEDMRHILESGLARIAGHAFLYQDRWSWGKGHVLEGKGAAVVFEII